MTKKEYEMYHKEVYDMYKNRLYPGDTVIVPESYYHGANIGVVKHFASKTVIVDTSWGVNRWYKTYRDSQRLIKVIDVNGDTSFMENWPKRDSKTITT